MDFYELTNELKRLRKNKKISQETMARDLHISRATLSNFESGNSSDIGLKKVIDMLEYLGFEFQIKEKSPFPTFEEIVKNG